ncbi:protein phosphatase 1B-like isoform X2 [Bolinopsis microptera]|uniref:protein phosphatase 1B-like isoform X2 n=1 Tax=Bolinopsis microptera TaxID=2820187 RepID=UPI003078D01A
MGAFLDKPITDKTSGQGSGNGLRYGHSSMQGWRMTMEDAHTTVPNVPGLDSSSFFGVYDGHCGHTIAKYSSENLLNEFLKHSDLAEVVNSDNNDKVDPAVLSKVMEEGFVILDDYMRTIPPWKNGEDQSGTTAVCAFITKTDIICANCGDSRAIFSRSGDLKLVTRDHKPYNDDERRRIEKAGGSVMMQRVNGSLAVSRALGDYEYKSTQNMPSIEQQVSPQPEIFNCERDYDNDEFLVIACDGIWDVMSNQQVLEFVHKELTIREDRGQICDNLIEECFQRGSRDNMSVVLVTFPAAPTVNEEAVLKDQEEKKRIAVLTERIQEKVGSMYTESSMVTVAQALASVESMLEVEEDSSYLRLPKRRIVETKLTELREKDNNGPGSQLYYGEEAPEEPSEEPSDT